MAHDTSPEAFLVQVQAYRRMTPTRRMEMAVRLSEQARSISLAGIRKRHPEYSERQSRHALFRMLLGDDLYRAAWPEEALETP